MQKIFHNGHIVTNDENQNIFDSMIINDGSVVYAGSSEEVLNLKNETTEIVDLNGSFVYPAMFEFCDNLFEKITDRLINLKKIKSIQNEEEINEDYENFSNFEEYKSEYLRLEKEFIEKGVSTIVLTKIGKLEFAFLKRISEDKCLTLDVVAYVDMISSKQVMNDNCVTYRKYRNHLRLGGYYLKIDGKIQDLKAWLRKPYNGSKSFCGFSEVSEEQLFYLMKEALSEKKQILFDVSGDMAIKQVLNVFEEVSKKENITEFYRPIFYNVGLLDRNDFSLLRKYDVSLVYELLNKFEIKKVKRSIGLFRRKRFEKFKPLIKERIRFVVYSKDNIGVENLKNLAKHAKCKFNLKMLKNNKFVANFTKLLGKILYLNFAYFCFDQDKKGVLETDKQANFIILKQSIVNQIQDNSDIVISTYIEGEKKY